LNTSKTDKETYAGIGLALITVIIWSGNYVVAKGISKQIPPISLAFYRWALASVCIIPLAWKKFQQEKKAILLNWKYLFWVSLSGIALFNSFIYIAGHYTSAINLALIGTTSAPIFATILAGIFLKEKVNGLRITGMVLCIGGILFLLSQGSWQRLAQFRFGTGDLWILASAFSFAVYNTLVKKKPAAISSIVFLMAIFVTGTLMLVPPFIIEASNAPALHWNGNMLLTIAYLGIGNSIIGFLCWNLSITKIGPARTVLFANLIPIFSTIEAVAILGEPFTNIHLISGVVVIAGLAIANLKQGKRST